MYIVGWVKHMKEEKDNLVINGEEIYDFINVVLNHTNLTDIEFRNCDFLDRDILKLIEFKEYDRIAFVDCTFEDETKIKNIITKSLSLTTNRITNYEFIYEMNSLERLTIVGGKIDAAEINSLKNLEYLRMSNSNVINIDKLTLDKLKYLFVDNTNIMDVSFVKKLYNLELLSISEKQKSYNRDFLYTIKDRVRIILDGIVEMEVFFDE